MLIWNPQAKDEIYLYSKEGVQLTRLAADFVGAASIASREKQSHFFVTLSGFNTPGTIACYDFTAPELERFSTLRTTKVNGLNPDDFEATQVWYESHDGTKVPMFIVRHKSTEFDGTASAIQCGTSLPGYWIREGDTWWLIHQATAGLQSQQIRSLVPSFSHFCKRMTQSLLFRTSGAAANLVRIGIRLEDVKIRFVDNDWLLVQQVTFLCAGK